MSETDKEAMSIYNQMKTLTLLLLFKFKLDRSIANRTNKRYSINFN